MMEYQEIGDKPKGGFWSVEWMRMVRGLAYTGRIHGDLNCVIAKRNNYRVKSPVAHIYDSNDMQFALELVDRANESVEMMKIHHFLCAAIRKSPLAKDKEVMRFVRKLEEYQYSCHDLNMLSRFSKGLIDAECERLGGNVEKRKPVKKGAAKKVNRKRKEMRFK